MNITKKVKKMLSKAMVLSKKRKYPEYLQQKVHPKDGDFLNEATRAEDIENVSIPIEKECSSEASKASFSTRRQSHCQCELFFRTIVSIPALWNG